MADILIGKIVHGDYILSYTADRATQINTLGDRAIPDKGYNDLRYAQKLSTTATLDFPSTAAGTVSDLTVTLTGAVLGDVVDIGVPHASVPTTGTFFAWVSATDTVTVRFQNNNLVTAQNPASGTFKVMILR